MNTKTKFYQRVDEPTPSGGAYSIMYFFSNDKTPTNRKNAKFVEVVEYDDEDNEINRSYLTV